jgi:hypothetical protein
VKRCSSMGEMVLISRRIIPRQADCSRSIPDQVGESIVRKESESQSRLISFEGKRTQPPWKNKEMMATQRGSCQDHVKRTGRRVSQLKKHLCYDNFSFDKRNFPKNF